MSLLKRLAEETPSGLRRRSADAMKWLTKRIRRLKISSDRFYTNTRQGTQKTARYLDGRMYCFFYRAKYEDILPYYDTFPCVLIIEMDYANKTFLGLNLHYIPPRYRARLLDELFKYTNNQNYDETTRIRMTYKILNSVTRMKFFKPCLKRYRMDHVEGVAMEILPEYWDIVAMLPLAQFEKDTVTKVYADSLKVLTSS